MSKVKNILVVYVVFGLLGCAANLTPRYVGSLPPPMPLDPQSSAIGVCMGFKQLLGDVSYKTEKVYFIKVGEKRDLYNQDSFIQSNCKRGDQIYLLNADPGRYAIVACSYLAYGSYVSGGITRKNVDEYTVFFPKESISTTEVTVAPGTVVFMGEYIIKESTSFSDPDDSQLHYAQMIAPGAKTRVLSVLFSDLLGRSSRVCRKGVFVEEKHDQRTEIKFLMKALTYFVDTGWEYVFRKRLEELKEFNQNVP